MIFVDPSKSERPVCDIPVGFAGAFGVLREPNGLYYMNARYYDPTIGRFLSEDPMGLGGGDLTLYSYAGNNPVVFVDPSGLCAESGGMFQYGTPAQDWWDENGSGKIELDRNTTDALKSVNIGPINIPPTQYNPPISIPVVPIGKYIATGISIYNAAVGQGPLIFDILYNSAKANQANGPSRDYIAEGLVDWYNLR